MTLSKTLRFNIACIALLFAAFVVRLYKINTPLADWHSFRQADTASVTREYVKNGVDLLHPRYHDLSNIQSGVRTGEKDNLEGWRMVEFPIVNGIIAAVLSTFPQLDLVVTSRLFSIAASLVTLAALIGIGKNLFSQTVGLVSGAVFAFMPYSVFYSRTILPEPYLVMTMTLSLLFFLIAVRSHTISLRWLIGSYVWFALALLFKPMAVFILPAFVAVVLVRRGIRGLFDLRLWASAVTFIPFFLWREWIAQFPSGIPASDWLFNSNGIRFKPAWFRWLFAERLSKLMLGYYGIIFFITGIATKWEKKLLSSDVVVWFWGIGILLYFSIIATGNVQHDYYQVLTLPFVALVVGRGIVWLWSIRDANTPPLLLRLGVLACILFSLFFSFFEVKGYYAINNPGIVEAGKAADRILPQDAKVIAPYMGDTAFIFQTNRRGWPIGFSLDKKIANGAQYYVSVNYDDETNALMKQYEVLESTPAYVIINLLQPKAPSQGTKEQ